MFHKEFKYSSVDFPQYCKQKLSNFCVLYTEEIEVGEYYREIATRIENISCHESRAYGVPGTVPINEKQNSKISCYSPFKVKLLKRR